MDSSVHNLDKEGEDIRLPSREVFMLHGGETSLELHEIQVEADCARAYLGHLLLEDLVAAV